MTGAGVWERIFLQLVNMSVGGGIVILLVLACRALLVRAPRRYCYALWALPLLRLLVPFTLEIPTSPLPLTADPIPLDIGLMETPQVHTGISSFNSAVNGLLPAGTPQTSANPLQIFIAIATVLYLAGLCAMLLHGLVALVRLRRRLAGAVCLESGVYEAAGIPTPFVLGLLRPCIYLPVGLTGAERAHVLAHERAHIRRLDHVTRLLAHLALCLHWWNPLVWLAFRLSARDMELSCDERVLATSGADIRAGYANTLLNLSATRARLPGTPLAFGESDAKTRITNVLRYRRPALWLSAVASLVCLLAAACALTSRAQETAPTVPHGTYGVRDILYAAPVFSFSYASAEDAPQYAVDETGTLLERGGLSSMDGKHEADEWVPLGALQRTDFDAVSFSALFPVPNYPETFSPDVVAADVAAVWALAPTAGSAQDALLLETHGGEMLLLLASGSLKADGTHARWLFALNDAGVPFDTVAIERSIGESLSLSQPVRCFAYYTDPGAPGWYLIAWICGDDMGYSILTCNEASGACQLQGNTLLQGAAVSDAPVLCGPHLGEEGQEIRLDAVLSNDPLLALVSRTADGARETRAVSGAPSLTIFPTTDGPIELGYSYREQAGAIDAPAAQADDAGA